MLYIVIQSRKVVLPKKSQLKDISKEQFKKVYNDLNAFKTVLEVGEQFGVSERTVRVWAEKLRLEGVDLVDRSKNGMFRPKDNHILQARTRRENELLVKIEKVNLQLEELKKENKDLKQAPPLNFEDRVEVKKLKDEVTKLNADLREAERQALTSAHLTNMIWDMKKHDFGSVPDWLQPKQSKNETHGIPCLFLSDIHFDEYVDPAQINYVNEFNRDIATKRLQHTFNTSIDILFNRTKNPVYDGFVLALGGDLLSGNIHEELAETNEDSIMRSLLALTDILIDGVELHLKYFKRIFIPCVVGNHGRLHKKPRAKNKVFDNYEWLVYQFMARHFKNDDRVTFLIPDGPDAHFRIYDQGFLLTHGDQFRGGNAIAGIFSPLMLGFHRKQKKQASVNKSFDVMMVGHFHQYVHTNQLVINGSVKGADEFSNIMNFSFERPQQALWVNHPENGMVFRTPILCDSYENGRTDFKKNSVFQIGGNG